VVARRDVTIDRSGGGALAGPLSTVDHKEYGKRYIIAAFIFLLRGGSVAACSGAWP
jgi:hypothetical protein